MKTIYTLIFSICTFYIQAQNCWPATAKTDLDINNIRAKLLNGGDMWWDGVANAGYEYPKVDTSLGELPKNIIFNGAIWMTALDDDGNLKCASQTYRNQGHEFWPGPLVYGQAGISDVICTNFDRFFPILRTELNNHISAFASANSSLSVSTISPNILQWPGKGNQYLSDTYNMDIVNDLAPFQDCNNNGIYDPQNGDYPLMKGDQSIFWVINDLGNTHMRSGGDPLGVEVQCMAYAYITNDAVNDATFYDYKVLKKTAGNLSDFYFSQFADPEIGGTFSSLIGCDTTLDYGFCYSPISGCFGEFPPILMMQLLKTPTSKGLTSFLGFENCGSGPQCDPDDAIGFRYFQEGKWGDGTPVSCGGTSSPFLYYGNPGVGPTSPNTNLCNWSECINGNTPGDRRFLLTSGPYDLKTNVPLDFTVAVMVAENSIPYSNCPDKNTLINPVVNLVDNFIANVDDNPYQCKVLSGIVDFEDENTLVSIYPNPANDFITIKAAEGFKIETIEIYDAIGKLMLTKKDEKNIDISKLSKGVYSIKISSQETNIVIIKKFILK